MLIVALLHSCEIFGVVLIFVIGGVTIWDGISKAVEEIKSNILVFGIGKIVDAIDNAHWYGNRDEGTLFDAVSCAEVKEPVGKLEFSCWSKAYSRLCA